MKSTASTPNIQAEAMQHAAPMLAAALYDLLAAVNTLAPHRGKIDSQWEAIGKAQAAGTCALTSALIDPTPVQGY